MRNATLVNQTKDSNIQPGLFANGIRDDASCTNTSRESVYFIIYIIN